MFRKRQVLVMAALALVLVTVTATFFFLTNINQNTNNSQNSDQKPRDYVAKIHVQHKDGSPVVNDTIVIEMVGAGQESFWGRTNETGNSEIAIYSDWKVKAVFAGGQWTTLQAFSAPLPSEYFPKTYIAND